jgi:hypothetical protein
MPEPLPSRPTRSTRLVLVGLLAVAMAAPLIGCGGPFLLLPGGELEGESASVPESWAFTEEIGTIQVETNPSDPYSINIWAVGMDEYLYLHAGANRTTWIEHMEADPLVRARIEGKLYELRATKVEDAAEFARFADAYEDKYSVRPRNENIAEIYVIRLGAR